MDSGMVFSETAHRVRAALFEAGIESPLSDYDRPGTDRQERLAVMQEGVGALLDGLTLDTETDGLARTPYRVAKMYLDDLCWGLDYNRFPSISTFEDAGEATDEMVVVKDCRVLSLCEHHLIPFFGHATVAYIPEGRLLGLSKVNRIVEFFSRRPQVQERLTAQIKVALSALLETDNVAVSVRARHLCVAMRGVRDDRSSTITTKLGGRFRSIPEVRAEFLSYAPTEEP